MDMKTILETAREIYEKTWHGQTGCCGDLDGAFEYIDGAVGEMISEITDVVHPVKFVAVSEDGDVWDG